MSLAANTHHSWGGGARHPVRGPRWDTNHVSATRIIISALCIACIIYYPELSLKCIRSTR